MYRLWIYVFFANNSIIKYFLFVGIIRLNIRLILSDELELLIKKIHL